MNDINNLDKTERVLLNKGPNDVQKIDTLDTEVVFFRRKTYSLSRRQLFFLVSVCLATLLISILITVFVVKSAMKHQCPLNSKVKANEVDGEKSNSGKSSTELSNKGPVTDDNVFSNVTWNDFRLPQTLVPLKYDLSLTIDLDRFVFNGSVEIELSVKQSTDFVVVNVYNLTILAPNISVEEVYTKRRIGIKSSRELEMFQFYVLRLEETLLEKSSYRVRFGHFAGPIQADLRGLYRSSYTNKDGETRYLATSQLQSTDARKVFPCFDEPMLKAEFAVTIIHQPGYSALSNAKLLRSQTLPNGWIKDEFQNTPIMSSYLLAFVVSDFKFKETSLSTTDLRIRLWSQPEIIEQTKFALSYVAKTYEFFSEYFNIAEVMPKADHVAVPDFSAGAMENWGLVIYKETSLLYDENVSSSTNMYMITLIVAHEIVHVWFGNMVTMKWWTDLWLNEGFASTLMFFAMDHAYPDWKVHDIQTAVDIFPVMIQDSLDTSHPVSNFINHPSEIIQFFDAITYQKGMAVLRMLRGFLGDGAFRKGLQVSPYDNASSMVNSCKNNNYIRRYKFSNAEMSQLWAIFTETINGRFDIAQIMDTWTRQMGYPVVTVTANGSHYVLQQDRFRLNPGVPANNSESVFGYKWYIPFTYKTQHNDTAQIQWLNLSSATIPRESDGWILGNLDVLGYYVVNYENDMWEKLATTLNDNHLVFSQSNRAALINNAFSLARAGRLQYHIALNMTTFLKSEANFVPWKAFLESIQFLRGMLSTTPIYGLLQAYIRTLVEPVFDQVQFDVVKGNLPQRYMTRLLLDLACTVRVRRATSIAKKMFSDWMTHGTRIPADFSQTVYSVGIREGGVYEWEFLWNKSCETNVATEMELMRDALTHTQQSWLLWRFMNWIFDEEKIRLQDVRNIVMAMSHNTMSRMIARSFIMANWKRFINMYGNDWFGLKEIIPHFTKYVNTEFHYAQIQQLFLKHPPKAATESANSALALIRANIRWMETSYSAIEEWLQKYSLRDK